MVGEAGETQVMINGTVEWTRVRSLLRQDATIHKVGISQSFARYKHKTTRKIKGDCKNKVIERPYFTY
jgi:hypothetical protein